MTEQELRPILERMARLVDGKVWYITEKGELQVSDSRPCYLIDASHDAEAGIEGCGVLMIVSLCVCVFSHQVVPRIIEAEQKEIDDMRAMIDNGASMRCFSQGILDMLYQRRRGLILIMLSIDVVIQATTPRHSRSTRTATSASRRTPLLLRRPPWPSRRSTAPRSTSTCPT